MLNLLQGVILNKEIWLVEVVLGGSIVLPQISLTITHNRSWLSYAITPRCAKSSLLLVKAIEVQQGERQQSCSAEMSVQNVKSVFSTCREGLNHSVLKFMASICDEIYCEN